MIHTFHPEAATEYAEHVAFSKRDGVVNPVPNVLVMSELNGYRQPMQNVSNGATCPVRLWDFA